MFINSTKAQFTLEQTYDTASMHTFFYVNLQQNGEKYVHNLYPRNNIGPFSQPYVLEMRLYNINHTIWKIIDMSSVPRPTGTYQWAKYECLYITDSLFDTDPLIEFMYVVQYMDTVATMSDRIYKWETYIINENQTILFYDTLGPFYDEINIPQIPVPIVQTAAGAKMMLASLDGRVNVYSIPGSLPTQYLSPVRNDNSSTDIFPNPSVNRVTIRYSLPQGNNIASIVIYNLNGDEVKRFMVDSTFDYVTLSTEDLPAGSYFYNIQTKDSQIIQGKKFIKIN